jgi:hypothetical protein
LAWLVSDRVYNATEHAEEGTHDPLRDGDVATAIRVAELGQVGKVILNPVVAGLQYLDNP